MKRIILLSLLGIRLVSNTQKQHDIAKFKISEAKINGTDVTQYYYERKQYFVFYLNEPRDLCLANVSGTNDEQLEAVKCFVE